MGNFGICCYENKPYYKETVLILEDYYDDLFRPKIYKVYRLNSFHNYGYRRQILLEQEFIEMQNKNITKKISIIDFFRSNSKILSKVEKALLKFTFLNTDIYLKNFKNPNNLFFNVAMFVLSNTKNNLDKKQEILLDIINSSFFEYKINEQKIDLDKFKKLIKNLIYISLTIFLNIILLQVFETKDNIIKLLEEKNNYKLADKYNKYSIPNFISIKIKSEINKNFTFEKLVGFWEEYLLSPIIFAGYSNLKNIANYNLKLRDDIYVRIINIFDSEKILNSFVKFKVD